MACKKHYWWRHSKGERNWGHETNLKMFVRMCSNLVPNFTLLSWKAQFAKLCTYLLDKEEKTRLPWKQGRVPQIVFSSLNFSHLIYILSKSVLVHFKNLRGFVQKLPNVFWYDFDSQGSNRKWDFLICFS